MVAWAKEAFKDEPGEYEFVRKVPGALRLAIQQTMKFEMVA